MNKKQYNEKIFDDYFEKKESIDYIKYIGRLGRRDAKVIKILNDYGIKDRYCLDVCPGSGRWLQHLKYNEAKYLGG